MFKKYFTVLFCTLLSIGAYAQEFSVKSEEVVKGQLPRFGILFSSTSEENGFIVTEIQTNGKIFTGYFTEEGRISIECVYTENERPAKLEQKDVVKLTMLYHSLAQELDPGFSVHGRLKRFIRYLISFHPVNEFFDNDPSLKNDEMESADGIYKTFTSFCDSIGETIRGFYVIPKEYVDCGFSCGDGAETFELSNGAYVCIEYAEVGPYNTAPCLGRCGPGCSDDIWGNEDHAFTRECFNHDLCAGATGEWMGPCRREFFMARDSFFNAPDCPSSVEMD